MKMRLAGIVLAVAAMAAMPAAAMAAPKGGPGGSGADGTCVSKGAKLLGGPTIAAAANGSLAGGNIVDFVILDHVFNNAAGTEAFIGLEEGTICGKK